MATIVTINGIPVILEDWPEDIVVTVQGVLTENFVTTGGSGVTVSAVDTATAAESVTAGLSDSNVSVVDTGTLAEQVTVEVTSAVNLLSSITDLVGVTEQVSIVLDPFMLTVIDTVSLSEYASTYVQLLNVAIGSLSVEFSLDSMEVGFTATSLDISFTAA